MEKIVSLLKVFEKPISLVFVLSVFINCAFSQVVKKVANGATAVDVTINTSKPGKFYYVLYNTNQGSLTADLVKQNALSAATSIKEKAGSMSFGTDGININQVRLITNLYGVFESYWLGLENVETFQISLPVRQPAFEYVSSVSGQSGSVVRYLLYRPEIALKNPTKPQPVLLFFHGNGEMGTDIELIKRNGPPKLINEGGEFDFVVASPQTYSPISWSRVGFLEEFVAKIKQIQNIDTNRIYISGLSGGGSGMYYYAKNYPSKIAALVPVSAVAGISTPCVIKDIPMWGFHNANDPTVSLWNLTVVVNAINACFPQPLVSPLVTIYPVSGHDSWSAAYNTPELYTWLLSKTTNDKLNTPPTANAGNNISIATVATLSGSATDNQYISSYLWEMKSGGEATILNAETVKPIVKDLVEGNYTFKLTAKDNSGATAVDEVTISASGQITNQIPLVFAGNDFVKTVTTESITIAGTATDPDGTIVNYTWTKISGPTLLLQNTTISSLTVTNAIVGNYKFRLTVADNLAATAFDEVNLTINSVPIDANTNLGTGLSAKYFNNNSLSGNPVLVRTDSTINFEWATSGSPSTIVNKDLFSTVWEGQIEAPLSGTYNFYTISDDGIRLYINNNLIINNWTPHSPTTNTGVIALTGNQKYKIKLEYFEAYGGATVKLLWKYPGQSTQIIPKARLIPDLATVVSPPIPNQAPVVNAGYDFTAYVTSTGITFTASANDSDGSISTYLWRMQSGGAVSMVNTSTTSLLISNLVTGNFVFRLTVTDNDGAVAFDEVNLSILPVISSIPEPPITTLGNGLKASYFNNKLLSGTPIVSRIDTTINFNWRANSPHPLINVDNFSALWEGQLLAPVSGQYVFSTTSDDGIRLWVNNQLIIDKWQEHYIAVDNGYISLTGLQKYDIKLGYFESGGGAVAKLAWAFPGTASQIIPKSTLFSTIATPRFETLKPANDKREWEIYPNPVSDVLNISSPNQNQVFDIIIYNAQGKSVYKSGSNVLDGQVIVDVRGFLSGLYFIIISTENEKIARRVIVE